jgi:hypothetical protein
MGLELFVLIKIQESNSMKIPQNKLITIVSIVLVTILIIVLSLNKSKDIEKVIPNNAVATTTDSVSNEEVSTERSLYKCSSDYVSYNDYVKGVQEYGEWYLKNNPGKTYEDVSTERTRLQKEMQCEPSPAYDCITAILKQRAYLQMETFADVETFDKYPAEVYTGVLQGLSPENDDQIMRFKTIIEDQLKENGINFAGKYTIVTVAMTGWGTSYVLVDRTNGNAFTLRFKPIYIDSRKDSNLLIINSKSQIIDNLNNPNFDSCGSIGDGETFYCDARPFYFLMKDGYLDLIGPKDIFLPRDKFWEQ